MLVSVCVPAHDAEEFIGEALASVVAQDYAEVECVVVDDGSADGTYAAALEWEVSFAAAKKRLVVVRQGTNRGAGAARNAAIAAASGEWICSLDADDTCAPQRVRRLLEAAAGLEAPRATLLGSRFERIPATATPRYAQWANGLSADRCVLERFREVTIVQPTWFFHRRVWEVAGKYDEDDLKCDDLRFFHRHLERGGRLHRVDEVLVRYRHRERAGLSFVTPRRLLVRWRVEAFARSVLLLGHHRRRWGVFSIWGAGRDAREFVSALSDLDSALARRIRALHDVDEHKLRAKRYVNGRTGFAVDVQHTSLIAAPFVVCVALDRFPALEAAVRTLAAARGLVEGVDYWHFN
ncbi:hypothetical protein CTAYLR_004407 [Chrysophaeum taylorii]|uniref:Glycosyltransferase 2-like domain-containing protein n=1 Tax=Chrysophaeum taylorii TaxID=2483200 RepID=A0AAD7ULR4_9STRA|nr:hypothetical protein CTAYLR_004407 [Chrysophaeum taylorii]